MLGLELFVLFNEDLLCDEIHERVIDNKANYNQEESTNKAESICYTTQVSNQVKHVVDCPLLLYELLWQIDSQEKYSNSILFFLGFFILISYVKVIGPVGLRPERIVYWV